MLTSSETSSSARTLASLEEKRVDRGSTPRWKAVLFVDYVRESSTRMIGTGVETAEKFACLRDMGVKLGQGCLIGRPARRPGRWSDQAMPRGRMKLG